MEAVDYAARRTRRKEEEAGVPTDVGCFPERSRDNT